MKNLKTISIMISIIIVIIVYGRMSSITSYCFTGDVFASTIFNKTRITLSANANEANCIIKADEYDNQNLRAMTSPKGTVLPNYSKTEEIPSDAKTYNGHYYKLFDLGGTFEDAEDYCRSLGGYLAVISDQKENDFLFSYIKSCGYENAYFGFSDREDEGVWKWLGTEEESNFTNWASEEPNSETYSEDYAMFYWKYPDGKWNDGNFGNGTVSDDTAFLCEWKGRGQENESKQETDTFIKLPEITLVSELKDLQAGEDTEIPLTVRIRQDIDWSDFYIEDGSGNVLVSVSAEEIDLDEDVYRIGSIAYDQVHINVVYSDNPSSNSTAVILYARVDDQISNEVTLRRRILVTKEMMQRYYDVLSDLDRFTESFRGETKEDENSIVTLEPDKLLNRVKEYLEEKPFVANVYLSGEDMLLYETVDGLMGYFQMTQVYEDEEKNTAGSTGRPTDLTEYQVQSQYQYDNSFIYAPVDPDVLVLCPLDGSSTTDRDGRNAKEGGKKLAKSFGGSCEIVTAREETNILHILHSGALEDYGTVMLISHGAAVDRGDGTSSILFRVGSYNSQEKLNAELNTWFSQHEGDEVYLRKLDYEGNYSEEINRTDLIPGIHMLAGLQFKYLLYDFLNIIPIKQFNLAISTDYIMDICGEIELPNTVFYMGACHSLEDNRFNQWVIQHHGVGVIGYRGDVNCLGEQEICKALFKTLMEKDQKSESSTGYRNHTILEAAQTVPGTVGLLLMDFSSVMGGADSQSMIADSEKLDFVYWGEGLLQGVIVDQDGDPVEGAEVHVARYLNGHFIRGQTCITATNGTYHFDHLEFGHYMVYVQKNDAKVYVAMNHSSTNGQWTDIKLPQNSFVSYVSNMDFMVYHDPVTLAYSVDSVDGYQTWRHDVKDLDSMPYSYLIADLDMDDRDELLIIYADSNQYMSAKIYEDVNGKVTLSAESNLSCEMKYESYTQPGEWEIRDIPAPRVCTTTSQGYEECFITNLNGCTAVCIEMNEVEKLIANGVYRSFHIMKYRQDENDSEQINSNGSIEVNGWSEAGSLLGPNTLARNDQWFADHGIAIKSEESFYKTHLDIDYTGGEQITVSDYVMEPFVFGRSCTIERDGLPEISSMKSGSVEVADIWFSPVDGHQITK